MQFPWLLHNEKHGSIFFLVCSCAFLFACPSACQCVCQSVCLSIYCCDSLQAKWDIASQFGKLKYFAWVSDLYVLADGLIGVVVMWLKGIRFEKIDIYSIQLLGEIRTLTWDKRGLKGWIRKIVTHSIYCTQS